MSRQSERAHARLLEASIERSPNCLGFDAFTADIITRNDEAMLGRICAGCDLIILCREYAELSEPITGYWAGKRYGRNTRPDRADTAA